MAGKKRFPFLNKKESDYSSSKKDDVGKVFVIKDQQLVVEEIIAEGLFEILCTYYFYAGTVLISTLYSCDIEYSHYF